jgi:hypothetical protein
MRYQSLERSFDFKMSFCQTPSIRLTEKNTNNNICRMFKFYWLNSLTLINLDILCDQIKLLPLLVENRKFEKLI